MLLYSKNRAAFAAILLLAFQIISCTPLKKVVYFYDLKDARTGKLSKSQVNFETPIQKNDQLWITVGGSNPADLLVLNSSNGTGSVAGGVVTNLGPGALGYLVEADGKIKIPYVGKVQADGLTRLQLEDTLTKLFADYTKNPVVNIRFLNYQFSVMGEVLREGRFSMPNERTTILEALSMAGDLTDLGKRENVLVVREENGQRNFARVNLTSSTLFNSPYYYVKTNDVIYVEPVRSKFGNRTGIPQYLAIISVAISLIFTIITVSKL
jgi:polysaccharide export outer membrane protein